jgi:hypothetical protein
MFSSPIRWDARAYFDEGTRLRLCENGINGMPTACRWLRANEPAPYPIDLPDMSRPISVSEKKISIPFFVNIWLSPPVPPPQEGRFAIVTNVGSGMRWTQCIV